MLGSRNSRQINNEEISRDEKDKSQILRPRTIHVYIHYPRELLSRFDRDRQCLMEKAP